MKIVNVNDKIDVINETREESIETLNYYLEEKGIEPLTESELRGWDIRGGETNAQLYEWAISLANDLQTEKCESKNAWRYKH